MAGFSSGGASFFALRSFLMRANGLRFNPREKRLRARLCINSTNWSLENDAQEKVSLELGSI